MKQEPGDLSPEPDKGAEKPTLAEAYLRLVGPEIQLIKKAQKKQGERERQKAEAEERLRAATKAEDDSAAARAREEVQDLELLLLISEGRISYGDETPPSPPSM